MEPATRDKVSINIKGIPARLRDDLARRAARSHRSLNREILHILEAAAGEGDRDEPAIDRLLERVREVRSRVGGPGLAADEIDALVAEGRP
jgi:alkanesulfonate monooxygenase SsuD/methylene tetrahydromethanopterin reductase-like flavin-dependent oxidoreductase (luciferase family)